ncbi:flavin reductase family protein [Euzebya tangerina]|uniref:flavin reductase family protein n=1 Tax=Euzebya tangerina TaxID=591198 RepID=UPI000E30FAA5|nr:flavin reductase family protein [Euzebya tangerina]
MPTFDPHTLSATETYHLLTSLVVPRPIAWVGTRSRATDGDPVDNLAPHSYFNVISSDPPVVHVTSSGVKDTLRNMRATGVFTVSIVSRELMEAMNTTAADAPAGVSEFDLAPITRAEAVTVPAPYVAEAPAVLECTVRSELSIGTGHMVFGDVTRIQVRDELWSDGRVDVGAMDPVGRLSGSQYTMGDTVLRLPRPSWDDLSP